MTKQWWSEANSREKNTNQSFLKRRSKENQIQSDMTQGAVWNEVNDGRIFLRLAFSLWMYVKFKLKDEQNTTVMSITYNSNNLRFFIWIWRGTNILWILSELIFFLVLFLFFQLSICFHTVWCVVEQKIVVVFNRNDKLFVNFWKRNAFHSHVWKKKHLQLNSISILIL